MAANPTSPSPSAESLADSGPASPGGSDPAAKPHLRIQRTHAAFVSKLYAMVADGDTDRLIAWTAEGDCFKVTDPAEFSRVVLPLYFKHNNWQSFVRQLNMYGFHKISDLAYGGVFGDTQLWMFKHPSFQRDQVRQLQNIKRRGTKLQPAAADEHSDPDAAGSAAGGLESAAAAGEPGVEVFGAASGSLPCQHAGGYIDELKDCIADLRHSNTQLQRENQEMRAAIVGCQGAFAGIMRFLETAIVQPAPRRVDGGVADAFRRLASDIAPIFSAGDTARVDSAGGGAAAAVASPMLPPRFFRDDGDGRRAACEPQRGPTLAPLRSGGGAQSGALSRIPSLSPPALTTPAKSAGTGYSSDAAACAHARKRCSSSSSSSSSSECEGGARVSPMVVLPPISGMVENIAHGYSAERPAEKTPPGWYQASASQLQSSLRETLPAKRVKREH
ncbi:Flocculation suppression protein [Coemansia sp. RSA 2711]|nr:Flocculation suppression protein [Coemansia sp. RSA 2711]